MGETSNAAQQFLIFRLIPEQYGINVLQVREVLEVPEITMLPRMPPYMRGVINIRGLVMPVIDLRLKLGLPGEEKTIHSRVPCTRSSTSNPTRFPPTGLWCQLIVELSSERSRPKSWFLPRFRPPSPQPAPPVMRSHPIWVRQRRDGLIIRPYSRKRRASKPLS